MIMILYCNTVEEGLKLQWKKWSRKNLTYKISKYSEKLEDADVDRIIATAFALWSKHTDLVFQPTRGTGDIDIRFEVGEHGDIPASHGPANPKNSLSLDLGHASFPGDGVKVYIHFDDDKDWSTNSNEGTFELLHVAMHEIGHALGLSHSVVDGSVMLSVYTPHQAAKLSEDDITGIQALYGSKTRVTVPSIIPELCEDSDVDTIFTSADGSQCVFKGKNYWRLTETGFAAGYPKLISTTWKGLPGNIDLAFTIEDRKTVFYKGSKYWVYVGTRMKAGYPKKVTWWIPRAYRVKSGKKQGKIEIQKMRARLELAIRCLSYVD